MNALCFLWSILTMCCVSLFETPIGLDFCCYPAPHMMLTFSLDSRPVWLHVYFRSMMWCRHSRNHGLPKGNQMISLKTLCPSSSSQAWRSMACSFHRCTGCNVVRPVSGACAAILLLLKLLPSVPLNICTLRWTRCYQCWWFRAWDDRWGGMRHFITILSFYIQMFVTW